jgi:hypothetical protein
MKVYLLVSALTEHPIAARVFKTREAAERARDKFGSQFETMIDIIEVEIEE